MHYSAVLLIATLYYNTHLTYRYVMTCCWHYMILNETTKKTTPKNICQKSKKTGEISIYFSKMSSPSLMHSIQRLANQVEDVCWSTQCLHKVSFPNHISIWFYGKVDVFLSHIVLPSTLLRHIYMIKNLANVSKMGQKTGICDFQ